MPQNARSLALTDLYRGRLVAIRTRAERTVQDRWSRVDLADFGPSYGGWLGATTSAVSRAQVEAVRLTAGYLGAFLALELGHRVRTSELDTTKYAGLSRDGRPLAGSFDSPRIGVLVALKDGSENADALQVGLNRALRMVEMDTMHSARTALLDGIEADDRFDGWQRALRGTCGACAAKARGPEGGLQFQVHPGCFPAGTKAWGLRPAASTTRWYAGDLIELHFASGHNLSVTPNHPVLTPQGWIEAGLLHEGGDVIRSDFTKWSAGGDPNEHQHPAFIEDVATAVGESSGVAPRSVPVAAHHFHGDGPGSEVAVVRADGLLEGTVDASSGKPHAQLALGVLNEASSRLAGLRGLAQGLESVWSSSLCSVCGDGVGESFGGRHVARSELLRFAGSTDGNSGVEQAPADDDAVQSVLLRKRQFGVSRDIRVDYVDVGDLESLRPAFDPPGHHLSSERRVADIGQLRRLSESFATGVEVDRVVEFRRVGFRGHVYNLQTAEGWYAADGVIVHNCQCVSEPVVRGASNNFPRLTGAEVFAAKSRQEQDEMLGPETAEKVRSGLPLSALVAESHLDSDQPDFITQRPVAAL